MNHIMIDIETLGRAPDAVIVQIAAVQFDPMTGETGEEFSVNIDPVSCQEYGLKIHSETVLFWLEQSKEVHQRVFYAAKKQLKTALLMLTDFIISIEFETKERAIVWANSPSFDLEILKNAYRATQLREVWEFRNERDFRTISKLFPQIVENHERKGLAHNALDDCRNQIAILHKCYQKILLHEAPNTEGVPEISLIGLQNNLIADFNNLIALLKNSAQSDGSIIIDANELEEAIKEIREDITFVAAIIDPDTQKSLLDNESIKIDTYRYQDDGH